MTDEQREIFRKVLDTHWEIKELMEETKKTGKFDKVLAKAKEHREAVDELKESMGEREYNNFIAMGRQMFAPVED
jgi:hypothetical protein